MKKKIALLFLLFVCVFTTTTVSNVYAEDNPNAAAAKKYKKDHQEEFKYEKKEEKQGGIVLKSKKYPLDSYMGHANTSDMNPILNSVLGLGNSMFAVTKLIYSGVDEGINSLYSKNIINDQIGKVSTVSRDIWTDLKDNWLITFVAIAFLIAGYFMMVKVDIQTGISIFAKAVLICVVAGFWMLNCSQIVKIANHLTDNLQGTIVQAGTTLTGKQDQIPKGEETEGAVALMRNMFFEATINRPYLMMNYGEVNENKITKDDDKRLDRLLEIKKISRMDEDVNNIVKKEVDDKENEYMDKSGQGVYGKVAITLVSLIVVIGLGIPLLAISLANLLIQFFILAIVVLLPFSFIISLIPKLSNSAFKLMGQLGISLLKKAFIALFTLFALLCMTVVDGVVPVKSTGTYVLNAIVMMVVLNALIAKRSELVSMVTGGHIVHMPNQGGNAFRRTIAPLMLLGGYARKASRQANKGTSSKNEEGGQRQTQTNRLRQFRENFRGSRKNPLSKSRQLPKGYQNRDNQATTPRTSLLTTKQQPTNKTANHRPKSGNAPSNRRQLSVNPTKRMPMNTQTNQRLNTPTQRGKREAMQARRSLTNHQTTSTHSKEAMAQKRSLANARTATSKFPQRASVPKTSHAPSQTRKRLTAPKRSLQATKTSHALARRPKQK